MSRAFAEFYGSTIPKVNFDVGPSLAGLLPIGSNANETKRCGFSKTLLSVFLLTRS